MINEQRVLETFLELVKIDSESRQERQVVDYIKQMLTDMGFDPIEDQANGRTEVGAGNIILTIPGTITTDKKLLFTAHVDTVFPGKGIEPVIREGYVYSAGNTILGSDDKAGVAAIIELLHVIKEQNLPHGDLQVVLTVGEESGLLGAKYVDQSLLQSNMGIALDSGGDVGTVIIQGPMQISLKATITGKAAHAGVAPEEGISAIEIVADAISSMKLGRVDKETTANIGVIEGGLATNIIPEVVTIKGEARSLNKQKLYDQVEHMKQALEAAASKHSGKVAIVTNEEYPDFAFTADDEETKLVAKAMENIGVTCNCVSSGGGSDASIFNGYGIKTLNLGIGMEKVHSVDERIAIEQLHKTARLLVEIVNVSTL